MGIEALIISLALATLRDESTEDDRERECDRIRRLHGIPDWVPDDAEELLESLGIFPLPNSDFLITISFVPIDSHTLIPPYDEIETEMFRCFAYLMKWERWGEPPHREELWNIYPNQVEGNILFREVVVTIENAEHWREDFLKEAKELADSMRIQFVSKLPSKQWRPPRSS